MERIARRGMFCLVSGIVVLLAACGGGSSSNGGGGGGGNPTAPMVTVSPSSSTIKATDTLSVTVSVSGISGTPTGSVKVSGGGYTSSAATLTAGNATITIPAKSLTAGTVTLTGSYTPDSASSSSYKNSSGTANVTVTSTVAPTVTVTPSTTSISVGQQLQVTVAVAGGSGSATPTGTVTLTSGSYSSSATPLSNGNVTVTIPAASLAVGTATLTASYAPDSASSSSYASASGTATVTVMVATATVTVTPSKNPVEIIQPLGVTVTVVGPVGAPTPTGSVTLTTGTYSSVATPLVGVGATFTIAAGALPAGKNTLTALFTPDTAGAAFYGSATGTAPVTVTTLTTPTVTVNPASLTLATSQSLSVTVNVTGNSGGTTPTGVVAFGDGAWAPSTPVPLRSGSATITLQPYSLVFGSNTLTASYSPDSQSSSTYDVAVGSATVSVARSAPTVNVIPASLNISPLEALNVTVGVGANGAPAGTGSITLSGGGYSSSSIALGGASTLVNIPAGALAAGSVILTAAYTPDTTSLQWYKATTGASAAIIVSSLVTVNQSTTLAPVTSQLLGINLESWYNNVANAGAINAGFGKAGIKAIRWPGGSWSDIWHWRTSAANLLPFNCNDPGPGTGWGGFSSFSDFVTNIVKAGPFDLALTANYGSNATCNGGGDPAEAAGWVAEAVSEGVIPSHVTVGNENYGSWEFDLHASKHDPSTYAASVIGANGFYQSIKNASPNTMVGVVVDANCTTSSGCTNGWDSTVLSTAKGSYNFVEYHYYPQYNDITSDTYLVHQAALDFTTNINTVKSELTTAGVPNTPIYVGEVGGNSANPGTQSWSITQGLYAGQLLGEAMNAGISRLTWWDGFGNCFGSGNNSPLLYGWQNWGAQSVFSDGPSETKCPNAGPIGTLSPTARAFQLFSNIAVNGESALGTSVSGDTNIRAYSATHSGGTALFLFNLNQNQSLPVTIKLSGGSVTSSDVQVITYDKTVYDQSNPANAGGAVWADPTTSDMGAQNLPLTLTLTPWSMNVVMIK